MYICIYIYSQRPRLQGRAWPPKPGSVLRSCRCEERGRERWKYREIERYIFISLDKWFIFI